MDFGIMNVYENLKIFLIFLEFLLKKLLDVVLLKN